jgi:hypothetical protein
MTARRLLFITLASSLTLLSSCLPPKPTSPPQIPPTLPPAAFCVVVTVTNGQSGSAIPGAAVSVAGLSGATDGNGYLDLRPVPAGPQTLSVTLDGYEAWSQTITVDSFDCGHDVRLTLLVPPMGRVTVKGKQFWLDGKPFDWKGVSAFQLVQFVATGQTEVADRFLSWMAERDVTVLRVFSTARIMFQLAPQDGARALPALLALAEKHRMRLEVVGIADSCPILTDASCNDYDPVFDAKAHIASLGQSCAASPACLGIELANEPRHPTQAKNVGIPAYLVTLAALVPKPALVAYGSESGSDDESAAYCGGDYCTVHADRADGDNGWRWVRHSREMQVLRDKANKPIVNDEPDRKVPFTDQHLALALLTRMYGIGDTFHYGGGRFGMVPTGDELAAFEARRRGWALVPSGYLEIGRAHV